MKFQYDTTAVVTCSHHFCGNSWVTVPSTTSGYPGGTIAWGICCKCGAHSAPARSWSSEVVPFKQDVLLESR